MITNEAEIRIALQATIASVLALYGFWGCALLVFLILLPWKPLLAVGGYLVQPVVDWRMQKARNRHEKGIAQIEEELDTFLRAPRRTPPASAPVPAAIPAPPKGFPFAVSKTPTYGILQANSVGSADPPEYGNNAPEPRRHTGDSPGYQGSCPQLTPGCV